MELSKAELSKVELSKAELSKAELSKALSKEERSYLKVWSYRAISG